MLQARIRTVYYIHPWKSKRDEEQERQYQTLQIEFEHGVHQLKVDDPFAAWATASTVVGKGSDPHGMETQ